MSVPRLDVQNTGDLAGIPFAIRPSKGSIPTSGDSTKRPASKTTKASSSRPSPTRALLEEYLGDFKWYLDVHLDIAEGGLEVIGEPHRWRADSDWKSGADNFSADSYHTGFAHRSVIEVGFAANEISGTPGQETQRHVTHADSGSTSLRLLEPEDEVFFGYPEEYVTDENLSDEQYDLAAACGAATGTIFPNLSFIHLAATNDPDKELDGFFSLRKWQPVAPARWSSGAGCSCLQKPPRSTNSGPTTWPSERSARPGTSSRTTSPSGTASPRQPDPSTRRKTGRLQLSDGNARHE
ncbi:hypothetical protein D8S78_21125 [Natrialba swarupiae]|nr:hypothetical protein [Natrialba swarupiae]